MLIIGFTRRTSKILPRIFCRNFRHCAVIIKQKTSTRKQSFTFKHKVNGRVQILELSARDLRMLAQNGWTFIEMATTNNIRRFPAFSSTFDGYYSRWKHISCVSFVKLEIGLRAPFVFTPDSLYKKLRTIGAKENNSITCD